MRTLFTAEHEIFRASFRAFIDRNLTGDSTNAALFARAGEHGLLGIRIPDRYGGGGVADPRFGAIAVEELVRAGYTGLALALAVHADLAAPLLSGHGDPELCDQVLPDMASGGRVGAVAGIDCPVRYVSLNESIRLDGAAAAVVNGDIAQSLLVVGESEHGERRVIVVNGESAGLSRTEAPGPLGVPGAGLTDIHFDGVQVARQAVLAEGAVEHLRVDHMLWLAVLGVAGAHHALSVTIDYVRERMVFGRPVAGFANTRRVLAGVLAELEPTKSYVDECLQDRADDQLSELRATVAGLRATELFGQAADEGLQLHGGYGYMREYSISQAFADARYLRLCCLADETTTNVLAAELGL